MASLTCGTVNFGRGVFENPAPLMLEFARRSWRPACGPSSRSSTSAISTTPPGWPGRRRSRAAAPRLRLGVPGGAAGTPQTWRLCRTLPRRDLVGDRIGRSHLPVVMTAIAPAARAAGVRGPGRVRPAGSQSNAELVERAARLGELAGAGRDAGAGARDPEAGRVSGTVVERYLRLGLQLDRHVEGTVDAYFGPPELAEEVRPRRPSIRGRSPPRPSRCWARSRTAGCATRSPACTRSPASSPGRRSRTRRGRALLRRPSAPHRRGRLRRCPCPPRRAHAGHGTAGGSLPGVAQGGVRLARAARADRGGGDRPGSGVDEPRGRPPCRRGRGGRDRHRQALGRLLLLPRRPPEPHRAERRPAEVGWRGAPPRAARDLPGASRRAMRQGRACSCGRAGAWRRRSCSCRRRSR